MSRRAARRTRLVTAGVVGAAAAGSLLVYFAPHKLFVDEMVIEPFPISVVMDDAVVAPQRMGPTPAQEQVEPVVLSSGRFMDRGHAADGTAAVVRLSDGTLVLRLEDLDVSNGPDLRVVLSRHPADAGNDVIAEAGLDLGALKGNRGDQTYAIPAGSNVDRFPSVIVWCRRFSYVFAAAQLSAA